MKRLTLLLAIIALSFVSITVFAQDSKSFTIKDGALAPALSGQEIFTEKNIKLESGKVTLVNFWATWCPYCIKELRLAEFRQFVTSSLKNKNFKFLAVAVDEVEKTKAYVEKREEFAYLKGHVFCDSEREQFHGYADSGIPRTFLVGPDGKIVKSYLGEMNEEDVAECSALVAKLLKK